jgi:hypothetical protein
VAIPKSQYYDVDIPRDAPTLPPKSRLSGTEGLTAFKDAEWTQEGQDPRRKDYEDFDELDLDALVDLLVVDEATDF